MNQHVAESNNAGSVRYLAGQHRIDAPEHRQRLANDHELAFDRPAKEVVGQILLEALAGGYLTDMTCRVVSVPQELFARGSRHATGNTIRRVASTACRKMGSWAPSVRTAPLHAQSSATIGL